MENHDYEWRNGVRVPVIGTVGDDGRIELTPEGESMLMGDALPYKDTDAIIVRDDQQYEGLCHDRANRLDEYAEAICCTADSLKAMAAPLPNHLRTTVLVAAQELIGASVRLYGVARELRNEP